MKGARKRIVVAGAGLSGLVAAAYLLREGHEVLLFEKTGSCGGLVSSFAREGFTFDAGPRAIGEAGILRPMLEELGIDLPLAKGEVSIGIGGRVVDCREGSGIRDYLGLLRETFPQSLREIRSIGKRIGSSSRMARILNGVPNPYFGDVLSNKRRLLGEFLPAVPGFLSVLAWTALNRGSIESALASISANPSLNDLASQHFFKGTPASFAFGYFENFQDYLYPLGGTGRLPAALEDFVRARGGRILLDTEIARICPSSKKALDRRGGEYSYDALIWCADLKSLYGRIDEEGLAPAARRMIGRERERYGRAKAGESVFSLFLAVDAEPELFARISKGHFIHTPRSAGLGELRRGQLLRIKADFGRIPKREILEWLGDFCRFNSYEISIPVLKDPSLAPPGKTGLAVSLLFDGELCGAVEEAGWFDEFRNEAAERMLDALTESPYPFLRDKLVFRESATPLTIRRRFGASEGAITGWSLEEKPPVPRGLASLGSAPGTAIPGVFKAGQWSYSPSGVPIAILTGRVAARAAARAP